MLRDVIDSSLFDLSDIRMENKKNNDGFVFVTVAFFGEEENLLLQINSLILNGNGFINSLIIIINEKIESHRYARFLYRIKECGDGADFNILVINRILLSNIEFSNIPGGKSQQILKLCISKYIRCKHYILLDSKNHLIKKLSPEVFIKNNKANIHLQSYDEGTPFYNWLKNAYKLCDIKIKKGRHIGFQTTTPYIICTELAQKCLNPDEIHTDTRWEDLVISHGDESIVEFGFYEAILRKYGEGKYVNICGRIGATLFASSPKDDIDVEKTIDSSNDINVFFFGIHRLRFKKLTERQMEGLYTMWKKANLFENKEDAYAFIKKMSECEAL